MEEMSKAEQAREERRKQAAQRKADRKSRLQESNKRQRAADTETYGEGSQLLEAQEGNIYDVETGEYDPAFNKEGTDETISNDGIDEIETEEEQTVDSFDAIICVNGTPFNATINGSIGDEITD
jgi:hypothetical protein